MEMKGNVIPKPITVLREEFIDNFLDLCNSSGLPFFVIEDVIKALNTEVHSLAVKQLKADKERYELLCKQQASTIELDSKDGG